jgi:hypothetical protein
MSAASSELDFVLLPVWQEPERAEAVDKVERKRFEAVTMLEC